VAGSLTESPFADPQHRNFSLKVQAVRYFDRRCQIYVVQQLGSERPVCWHIAAERAITSCQ